MKTILQIEIETPDSMEGFFPDEGDTEDNYPDKEELIMFRKRYADDIVKFLVNAIKYYIVDPDELTLRFLESDCACENLDTLSGYGIRIDITEQPPTAAERGE